MAEKIVAPKVEVSGDDRKLTGEQREIAKKIHDTAIELGVDPEFALATAWQENRFRSVGKSSAGAIGTMQIMPATAKSYGVNLKQLRDLDTNIKLGVQILKDNLDRRDGDKRLALIDYNAGPKVTDAYLEAGEDIKKLPSETKDYLQKISDYHAIDTHHGNEPSPFDDLMPREEDLGESPFGDTENLPPHLQTENRQVEQPSMGEQIISYGLNNPEEVGVGAGAAYLQSKINQGAEQKQQMRAFEEGLRRAQQPTMPLEEQFKVQQGMPPEQKPLSSGEKWSQKTVGSMGPGGESTTEAARNYRIQQRLNVGEDVQNPRWQPNRAGVILPKGQQEIIDRAEAQRLIDEAERAKSPLQRARESLNIQSQRPTPSMLGKIGSIGKLPVAGPLSTGFMAARSVDKFKQADELESQGDVLGAAMARVNGFASGIGAIPATPSVPLNVLKGVGMAGSLGMTGVESLRDYLFPYKSVVEEKRRMPPQLKKADGGYIPLSLKDVYFHRKARG